LTRRPWHLVAESSAVADGVHRAMPRWECGVPYCREDGCAHYDGKRCELLGQRPGAICVPAVSGMAATLDRRVERGLCPCCCRRSAGGDLREEAMVERSVSGRRAACAR
jgi:hypothetical protein